MWVCRLWSISRSTKDAWRRFPEFTAHRLVLAIVEKQSQINCTNKQANQGECVKKKNEFGFAVFVHSEHRSSSSKLIPARCPHQVEQLRLKLDESEARGRKLVIFFVCTPGTFAFTFAFTSTPVPTRPKMAIDHCVRTPQNGRSVCESSSYCTATACMLRKPQMLDRGYACIQIDCGTLSACVNICFQNRLNKISETLGSLRSELSVRRKHELRVISLASRLGMLLEHMVTEHST